MIVWFCSDRKLESLKEKHEKFLKVGGNVVVQFYPWFKFSFLLFQTHYHVIIIHYHTQKQKKRKFEPRIKLNHNSNACLGTCSHESGMIPLPLGKSKDLLLWENLNILCPLKSASVYFDWPEKKLIFSHEDVAISYRYIIALHMFYRKK